MAVSEDLLVSIKVDTSKGAKSLGEMTSAIKEVSRASAETSAETEALAKSIAEIAKPILKLADAVQKQNEAFKLSNKIMQTVDAGLNNIASENRELAVSVKRSTGALREQNSEMGDVVSASRSLTSAFMTTRSGALLLVQALRYLSDPDTVQKLTLVFSVLSKIAKIKGYDRVSSGLIDLTKNINIASRSLEEFRAEQANLNRQPENFAQKVTATILVANTAVKSLQIAFEKLSDPATLEALIRMLEIMARIAKIFGKDLIGDSLLTLSKNIRNSVHEFGLWKGKIEDVTDKMILLQKVTHEVKDIARDTTEVIAKGFSAYVGTALILSVKAFEENTGALNELADSAKSLFVNSGKGEGFKALSASAEILNTSIGDFVKGLKEGKALDQLDGSIKSIGINAAHTFDEFKKLSKSGSIFKGLSVSSVELRSSIQQLFQTIKGSPGLLELDGAIKSVGINAANTANDFYKLAKSGKIFATLGQNFEYFKKQYSDVGASFGTFASKFDHDVSNVKAAIMEVTFTIKGFAEEATAAFTRTAAGSKALFSSLVEQGPIKVLASSFKALDQQVTDSINGFERFIVSIRKVKDTGPVISNWAKNLVPDMNTPGLAFQVVKADLSKMQHLSKQQIADWTTLGEQRGFLIDKLTKQQAANVKTNFETFLDSLDYLFDKSGQMVGDVFTVLLRDGDENIEAFAKNFNKGSNKLFDIALTQGKRLSEFNEAIANSVQNNFFKFSDKIVNSATSVQNKTNEKLAKIFDKQFVPKAVRVTVPTPIETPGGKLWRAYEAFLKAQADQAIKVTPKIDFEPKIDIDTGSAEQAIGRFKKLFLLAKEGIEIGLSRMVDGLKAFRADLPNIFMDMVEGLQRIPKGIDAGLSKIADGLPAFRVGLSNIFMDIVEGVQRVPQRIEKDLDLIAEAVNRGMKGIDTKSILNESIYDLETFGIQSKKIITDSYTGIRRILTLSYESFNPKEAFKSALEEFTVFGQKSKSLIEQSASGMSKSIAVLSDTLRAAPSNLRAFTEEANKSNQVLIALKQGFNATNQPIFVAQSLFESFGKSLRDMNAITIIDKIGLLGLGLGLLGAKFQDSEKKIVSWSAKAAIAVGIAMSSFSLLATGLLKVIGSSLYSVGQAVFSMMSKFSDAEQKSQDIQARFKFAINGFSREMGAAAAGTLNYWDVVMRQMADSTVYSQDSITKSIKVLVAEGTRLGLTLEQNTRLLRISADVAANSGIDIFDATQALLSGLSGNSNAVQALGLDLRETAVGHTALAKASSVAIKNLSDEGKVVARVAAIFEQTAPILGAAANATDTISGSTEMFDKKIKQLQNTLGQNGVTTKAYRQILLKLANTLVEIPQEVTRAAGAFLDFSGVLLMVIGKLLQATMLISSITIGWQFLNGVLGQSPKVIVAVAKAINFLNATLGISLVQVTGVGAIFKNLAYLFKTVLFQGVGAISKMFLQFGLIIGGIAVKIVPVVLSLALAASALYAFGSSLGSFFKTTKVGQDILIALKVGVDFVTKSFKSLFEEVDSPTLDLFVKFLTSLKLIASVLINQVAAGAIGATIGLLKLQQALETKEGAADVDVRINKLLGYMEDLKKKSIEAGFGLLSLGDSTAYAQTQQEVLGIATKIAAENLDKYTIKTDEASEASKNLALVLNVSVKSFKNLNDETIGGLKQYIDATKNAGIEAKKNGLSNAEISKITLYQQLLEIKNFEELIKRQTKSKQLNQEIQKILDAARDAAFAKQALEADEERKKIQEQALEVGLQNRRLQGDLLAMGMSSIEILKQDLKFTERKLKLEAAKYEASSFMAYQLGEHLKLEKAITEQKILQAGRQQVDELGSVAKVAGNLGIDAGVAFNKVVVPAFNHVFSKGLGWSIEKFSSETIAAFALASGKFFDSFEGFMAGAGSIVGGGIVGAAMLTDKLFKTSFTEGAGKFSTVLSKVAGTVGKVFDGVMSGVAKLFDPEAIKGMADWLTNLVEKLPDALMEAFNALVDAMGKIIDKLPETVNKLMDNIGQMLDKIISKLPEMISKMADALVNFFDKLPDLTGKIFDALPKIIDGILAALPRVIDAILRAIPKIIIQFVKAVPKILMAIVQNIPAIVQSLVSGIIGALGEIAAALVEEIANTDHMKLTESFLKMIPKLVWAFVSGIGNGLKRIFKAFSKIFSGLKISTVTEGAEKIADKFKEGVKKLTDGAKKEASKIFAVLNLEKQGSKASFTKDPVKALGEATKQSIEKQKEGGKSLLDQFGGLMTRILAGATAVWRVFWGIISSLWQVVLNVLNTVGALFAEVWQGLLHVVTQVGTKFIEFFNYLIEVAAKAVEFFKEMWNKVKEGLEKIANFLGELGTKIWDGLKAAADAAGDFLKGLGEKVWSGLKEGVEGAGDFFKKLGGKISEGFKDAFPDLGAKFQKLMDDLSPSNLLSKMFKMPPENKGPVENALNIDVPWVKFAQGGIVPGMGAVPGDSLVNDRVMALVSPGEAIIPRSISQDPRMKPYVDAILDGSIEKMLPAFARLTISTKGVTYKDKNNNIGVGVDGITGIGADNITSMNLPSVQDMWKIATDKAWDNLKGFLDNMPKFHSGGMVPSFAFGGEVPSMLQSGEFVMSRKATNRLGGDFLNGLNSGGSASQATTVNMDIKVAINASSQSLDETYIRTKLIPAVKDEFKKASLRGDFLLSDRGLRTT
jgi:phage-related protein